MEAFLTSTIVATLAEMGDKTQLLGITLAIRFQRPFAVIAGLFVATIVNHFVAATIGSRIGSVFAGDELHYVIALAFAGLAIWALVPRKIDEEENKPAHFGVFIASLFAFFLLEIGDKTQIASLALAAQFQNVTQVATGTTLGVMLANVPVIFLGHAVLKHVQLKIMRIITAGLFFGFALWVFAETVGWPRLL